MMATRASCGISRTTLWTAIARYVPLYAWSEEKGRYISPRSLGTGVVVNAECPESRRMSVIWRQS